MTLVQVRHTWSLWEEVKGNFHSTFYEYVDWSEANRDQFSWLETEAGVPA